MPLPWPTPPDTPPKPQEYTTVPTMGIVANAGLERSHRVGSRSDSDFDLVLRLVDFTGLRPVLAQRLGWVSARGYEPFDPISFFLLNGWQLTNHWTPRRDR